MTQKQKFTKATIDKDYATILEMALDDYKVLSKTPGYKIDMYNWMVKQDDVCRVCLAGCVMARSLKLKPKDDRIHSVNSYLPDNSPLLESLYFINDVRLGFSEVLDALKNPKIKSAMDQISINYNNKTGRAPIRFYRNLVKTLKNI